MTTSAPNFSLRFTYHLLGILFLMTGCAGLLAEQSFEKLLTALLGASTPAAAVVLSVYFLGLTIGNALYRKWQQRFSNPLKTYGLIELGIAFWAAMLALFSSLLVTMFAPLLGLGYGNGPILLALRFFVACIWIIPPTILMGATFPAIADALESLRIPNPRKATSAFYAFNLLGAVLGALLGPYWIFPVLGLKGALVFTFFLDILAGSAALILASRSRTKRVMLFDSVQVIESFNWRDPKSLIFVVAFLSGFIFFGLEIVWTHLFGAAIGTSVYAFAAMLTLVLIGLGMGSLISTMLFKEDKPLKGGVIGILFMAGSVTLVWQHSLWPDISPQFAVWGAGLKTFKDGEILRWIQAARLILPPSVIFGMVYPALFRMEAFPLKGRARMAAMLGGINAIGCVLGALVVGFIAIPRIGSAATLVILGLLALVSAALISWPFVSGKRKVLLSLGLIGVGCLWGSIAPWDRLALTFGGHVYFRAHQVYPQSQLVFYHEDTLGGITTVVRAPMVDESGRQSEFNVLLTNGKFQANDAGESDAQIGFAAIPFIHTRKQMEALVIGFGSGHTARVVKDLGIERIDIAEIAPGIIKAAEEHFSKLNGNILKQPKVSLILEDGRNHLLLTKNKYDLITMELSSIWFAGSTSLYSVEFYELAKKRMNQGGILQQWIQLHHIGIQEVGSVVASMRSVFPYVEFWISGGQGIIIASEQPLAIQEKALWKLGQTNLWGVADPTLVSQKVGDLLHQRMLSAQDVDRMLNRNNFPLNTDSNRFLEYAAPKYNLSRENYVSLNTNALARFASFEPLTLVYSDGTKKGLPYREDHAKILFGLKSPSLQVAPASGP